MKNTIILPLLCACLVIACSKDDDKPTCNTDDITYTNTTEDIFSTNCTLSGCHNSGSINGSLADYDDAVAFVMNKPIIAALKHEAGAEPMPQGFDKLSSCTISQIEAWIDAGTPE